MKSAKYKDGWNYRCTYVAGGKYKLPRNIPKNYEFIDGFNNCDTAYVLAISEYMQSNSTGPVVYPATI